MTTPTNYKQEIATFITTTNEAVRLKILQEALEILMHPDTSIECGDEIEDEIKQRMAEIEMAIDSWGAWAKEKEQAEWANEKKLEMIQEANDVKAETRSKYDVDEEETQ